MRTFLLLVLLAVLGSAAHAQDLLTKRNGDEILVKVTEITPSEVKYRRADNLDGPLISVWKADVFMIRYANGTKEVFGTGTIPRTATLPPPAPAPAPPAPALAVVTPAVDAVRETARKIVAPAPAAPEPSKPAPTEPALPVIGNEDPNDAMLGKAVNLNGPRLGATFLTPRVVDRAKEQGAELSPFLTQFGWQFEGRLFRLPNGVSALVEFVPLIGGLEQGKFLPSLTGMLGIRGAKGLEFGVGPNVTPLGASVVVAAGASFQSGGINFPVNIAVAPSNAGTRVSLLVGFNVRHK